MTLLGHPRRGIREWRRTIARRRKERLVDAARTTDPVERELIEGRIDDWKEDVFTASGDGITGPGLPETTAKGLYEEFERDR